MKKIILMSVVITLFAITATSCIFGFQSTQIQFKYNNSARGDAEITLTNDDDRFTMKEVKWNIPAGETKNSETVTVTWFGFNQIPNPKFKLKYSHDTKITVSGGLTTTIRGVSGSTDTVEFKNPIVSNLHVADINVSAYIIEDIENEK